MSSRRKRRNVRRGQRSHLGPFRLVLEPLEARRLLAGLNVSVYIDQDNSRNFDPVVDSVAPNRLVYVDLNENKVRDVGDPTSLTDHQGTAFFADLEPGDYSIGVVGTDRDYPSISISTFVTVSATEANQQPFSIRLSSFEVPENVPGAVIGQLDIVNAGASGDYEFYLFDPRFVIEDRQLKLDDRVHLDFEFEQEVKLTIAATNGVYELYEQFTIRILDRSELVPEIILSRLAVEERTSGAVVGQISVKDAEEDNYHFTVSDQRFEVVGALLKLRATEQVEAKHESEIALRLSASATSGSNLTATFPIAVIPKQSPYHNSQNPADVNGDGVVSPIDALIVINDLNANGAHPVPSGGSGTGEPPLAMPDVNGDGMISPLDALWIINQLNDNIRMAGTYPGFIGPLGSRPEGESSLSDTPDYAVAIPLVDFEIERRRKENLSIDAELEVLLDQLFRERM